MKKFISIILTVIMLTSVLCSCSEKTEVSQGIQIVCTAFPQYDFVKNILGSESGITLLLDNGADLHSYEPTAQDIIKIGSADMFVYVGGASDSWVEGAIKSANNPELKSVSLMDLVDTYDVEYIDGMEHSSHEAHDGDHSEEDEHIWLSLRNAVTITNELCNIICEIDNKNAETYKANTEQYINSIENLDEEYKAVIESAKRKELLFADRFPFRYLTEDYNLGYYAAFAGCSSESEASFKTIAFLIDKTNELKLPAIIIIEGTDGTEGSIAKTVSDATQAKILTLDSCQSVSKADIENGTSYLGIMQNNLNVLMEALN